MKEHKLRVSESNVMRTIYGPKIEEFQGGWRKLHNEEHQNLYSSHNIITAINHYHTDFIPCVEGQI
jgi:hypothetical protein